jgi:DHA1 family multidrug resistance protein-like MFS transporter
MSNLIRDSAFGRLVRFASSSKYFTCAEERDLSPWKKYVHEKKSGNAAHHGHIGARGDDSDTEDRPISGLGGVGTRDEPIGSHPLSSASSQTQVPDDVHTYNIASGVRVDPEKGKDIHVVDWYGSDNPNVSNDI